MEDGVSIIWFNNSQNKNKYKYMLNRIIDLVSLRESMVKVIKNDKRKIKRGVVRYELFRNLSGMINCIDREVFDKHTRGYNIQGFYEYKRLKVKLEKIPCELVVMRHQDETKVFKQFDGLLSSYLKADCELCYYEVIL